MRALQLAGVRFGRLEVLSRAGKRYSRYRWDCRCDCGELTTVDGPDLMSGRTRSCGCLRNDRVRAAITTHGATGSSEYATWSALKSRCHSPTSKDYPDYGGRGITVCARWRKSFAAFLRDMGPRPEGFVIDRKDNDGNYTPSNCRWITQKESANNRRRRRWQKRPD